MLKRYNTGVDNLGSPSAGESRFRVYKNCRSTRPAWMSDKPSVFRILPGANPENPIQFDSFMLEDMSFGNWLFVVPQVVGGLGTDKDGISFALQNGPDDNSWSTDAPYSVLYSAIKEYAKLPDSPRSVVDMVESKDLKVRLFPAPARSVIVSVLPYYRDGKDIAVDGKEYVEVLTLSESSFLALSRYIRNKWNQDEQIDITDPNGGFFLCMWNKEKAIPPAVRDEYKISIKGTFGYDMALVPTFPILGSMYDGMPARLKESQIAEYRSLMRPIHEYVNYMSYDEQAALICKQAERGSIPAWLVMYAFEPYPEWISKGVRMKAQSSSNKSAGYRAPEVAQQPQYPVYQPYTQQPPYPPQYAQAPQYPSGQPAYQRPVYTQPSQPAPPVQPNEPVGTAFSGQLPPDMDFAEKPKRNSFGSELQSQVTNAATNGMDDFDSKEIPF